MVLEQGGEFDLRVRQGATFERLFALREADQVTPVPLTGYAARAQARESPGGALLLEFTCTVDEVDGTVTLAATAAQTALLTRGGVYDVELVKPGPPEVVEEFLSGRVLLEKQVTVTES